MNNCSNLYYLSTVACKLGECLSEKELTTLSADLILLGDLLASLLAHRAACEEDV